MLQALIDEFSSHKHATRPYCGFLPKLVPVDATQHSINRKLMLRIHDLVGIHIEFYISYSLRERKLL